jgi:hypothetical protein
VKTRFQSVLSFFQMQLVPLLRAVLHGKLRRLYGDGRGPWTDDDPGFANAWDEDTAALTPWMKPLVRLGARVGACFIPDGNRSIFSGGDVIEGHADGGK